MFSRNSVASLLSALLLAASMGLMSRLPVTDGVENQYALGLLYALRGPVAPPPGAVVVAIDESSLSWLRQNAGDASKSGLLRCLPHRAADELSTIRGPGSLPRSVHACLLAELRRLGVPVVAFDILFASPGKREDDLALAAALRSHAASVILVGVRRAVVRDGAAEILTEQEVRPYDFFEYNAASTGTFIVPRSGGPVYGYWPRLDAFPTLNSLPEEAMKLYSGSRAATLMPARESGAIEYFWIYGAPGTIETIPLRHVLSGDLPDRLQKQAGDTVVFVGASDPTATNYPDTFPTFYRGASDADASGVELAATAYLNLLHSHRLLRPSPVLVVLLTLLVSAIIGYLTFSMPSRMMLAVPSLGFAYLTLAIFAFNEYRLFLPVTVPVFLLLPVAFVLAVLVRYQLARKLIMRLAPAPVALKMLTRESDTQREPVSEYATVMFIDLIGSSLIAERITPFEFSQLLNGFHNTVTHAVNAHGGLVAAFMGDGAMIVFPREQAQCTDAVRACDAAVTIIREVHLLNEENHKVGLPHLAMRIGINTGLVAEGDIGGAERYNFSVVGDAVNVAARLEQLGKSLFPGETDVVLVGHESRKLADQHRHVFRDCGLQQITGRLHPENVFRLMIG